LQRFYVLDALPEKIIIGHLFFIDQRCKLADCSFYKRNLSFKEGTIAWAENVKSKLNCYSNVPITLEPYSETLVPISIPEFGVHRFETFDFGGQPLS
jgi:hypothetical protein